MSCMSLFHFWNVPAPFSATLCTTRCSIEELLFLSTSVTVFVNIKGRITIILYFVLIPSYGLSRTVICSWMEKTSTLINTFKTSNVFQTEITPHPWGKGGHLYLLWFPIPSPRCVSVSFGPSVWAAASMSHFVYEIFPTVFHQWLSNFQIW